ncbi:G-type lectin S-receptor-like serine/threonine-protein kinase SD2-5 [Triticum aestivum]|uniref:G-type lectin S-receptor-like serine/threonine-protein kinase SD2-5 n=1 Tax=Triticum aestivum TaxID=4565 RepID=UPI001D01C58B|nr:G-type lectin S-receptor-like serine/threonine-protein kinase SD2-5 [Triticum aestivum]
MGLAILFFLLLHAAAAPSLLLAAEIWSDYCAATPSTIWINNDIFFKNLDPRNIVTCLTRHSGAELYIGAGFFCVSSRSPCDEFLFAVIIDAVRGQITITESADGYHPIREYAAITTEQPQVVWSANRARLVSENATLEFNTDGNLVLCDADGSHVWSTNTSNRSVAGITITDIGNLVLFDHKNATVWQSFDHPTDTLLPGQSLLEGMRLIANTSATNTTENHFFITVLPDGLYAYVESTPPQVYLKFYFSYHMGQHKARKGPTEVTFINGNLTILGQPRKQDMYILLPQDTYIQYMRLDFDGHLRLYGWSDEEWTVLFDVMQSEGMNDCDYPTVCGENSICTDGQCGCPVENNSSSSYFKLVDERKPNLGCTPLIQITCQEIQHHRLLTLPNISYFDSSHMVNATSIDDCKRACLKNCSCMAVLFRARECVWVTKVFSLRSTQSEDVRYNSFAYLKVQLSPNGYKSRVHFNPSNENKRKVMLGATLGVVTTLVLLVIVVTLSLHRRKYEEKDEFDFDQLPGMLTMFSFEKLSECTDGFNKKLGGGGFGSVFEGELGGEKVAVKRLESARQGKKEFLAEVETIGSIEHINLVKLIGFCVEKTERLLVYEYMSRGSLDRWIYYRHNNAPLDWCTRWRIILAKGLCYLHEECRHIIAHLDIKPQNILLDGNFNAKVADFGLCKLINRDQSKVVTMMRGTPGYPAPEWLTSRITEKVDVYSFGVVLMEIVSGRKNIDTSQPEEDVQLINLLREKAQNNHLIDLIDKHGEDMVTHQEEVIQIMKLAIWCLQQDSIRRPSMSTVIKALEGAISIETFEANSVIPLQDNPSAYSVTSQTSTLSGPR